MKVEKREYRGEEIYVVKLNRWLSHAREWCAKVTGLSEKYGLALDFCKVIERNWSRSGRNGTTIVALKGAGYYKISNPTTGAYGREAISYYYWDGIKDEMEWVDENDVYKFFKKEKEVKNESA